MENFSEHQKLIGMESFSYYLQAFVLEKQEYEK